jgi:hypothetical protein
LSASNGKPITGASSLFAGLFPHTGKRAEEDYQRALRLARTEEKERWAKEKSESEERKEGAPTCWIN